VTIRGTLVLAAVLAALLAYLALTRAPDPRLTNAAPALATALDRATRIEVAQGPAVTTFVRRDGTWNDERVPDLLETLVSLRVLATIDDAPTDASIFGFGPDAPRLRVIADTDVVLALEIGTMNPAETGVYVRHNGETRVLLVGALLRWELDKLRRVVSTTAPP
jgi:hypothetical protein